MFNFLRHPRLILPAEHGSWALLLVPAITGAGVSLALKGTNGIGWWSLLLAALASLAVFLARQPLTLWLRIRRGKAAKSQKRAAQAWLILLGGMAGLLGLGLLLLGRGAIFFLALPAAIIVGLTQLMQMRMGPRQLSTELVGVLALALTAPAAVIALTGNLSPLVWGMWVLSSLHSIISVIYVRLRVDRVHDRVSNSLRRVVIITHVITFLLLITAGALTLLPVWVLLPFGLLLIRALLHSRRTPTIENVKRFGFMEMGYGILFAAWVIGVFAVFP